MPPPGFTNGRSFRIKVVVGEHQSLEGASGHVTLDNSLAGGSGDVLKADCVKFSYVGEGPTAAGDWTRY